MKRLDKLDGILSRNTEKENSLMTDIIILGLVNNIIKDYVSDSELKSSVLKAINDVMLKYLSQEFEGR